MTTTDTTADEVARIVADAVAEVNRTLPPQHRLTGDPGQRLLGAGGGLDSLGLVSLLSAIESRVAARLGVEVSLMDERAMEREPGPYGSLGDVTAYLRELLAEAART